MSVLRVARDAVAVALAIAVLFACVWTVFPAPSLPLLALAVVVPELAPWLVVTCVVALVAVATTFAGRVRAFALGPLALALAFAIVPLARLPATLSTARNDFAAVFPANTGAVAPGPGAFDPAASFMGYPHTQTLRIRYDLPVVARDGSRLGLDLYEPAVRGTLPVLVVVYGGAWIFGSRADVAEVAQFFAGIGYAVVALDYRHAPAHRYPTQLDDVRAGLATIARNAGPWKLDLGRVAILGRSAGAELALLAAYEPGPLAIRAAIAYYAPTDLLEGYARPPRPDPANVRGILRAYLGGPPAGREAAYRAASPLAHVRPGLPPTLLVAGDRDELVLPFNGRRLRDALRAAGDRVVSIEIPWSDHAFDVVPNGLGGQIARYYTERFLAATLAPV